MAHGFVTLNIKHRPEIRTKSHMQEKRDSATSEAFVSIEAHPEQEQKVEKSNSDDVAVAPLVSKYN